MFVFIQWANSQITAAIWELFRMILCLLTSRTAKDKQGQKINDWTPHRSKGENRCTKWEKQQSNNKTSGQKLGNVKVIKCDQQLFSCSTGLQVSREEINKLSRCRTPDSSHNCYGKEAKDRVAHFCQQWEPGELDLSSQSQEDFKSFSTQCCHGRHSFRNNGMKQNHDKVEGKKPVSEKPIQSNHNNPGKELNQSNSMMGKKKQDMF